MDPTLNPTIIERFRGYRDDERRMEGHGEALFVGGNKYRGNFAKNQMHGKGTFTWPDGTEYKGTFEENEIKGHGQYTWPDGSTYEGTVRCGRRDGRGRVICDSGAAYSGAWRDGKRSGKGVCVYNEQGSTCYAGEFKSDLRHGKGVMAFENGDLYRGQWRRGVKCGLGEMRWPARGESYKGLWLDDLPHGYGEHVWFVGGANGEEIPQGSAQRQFQNRYVGQWHRGERHGYGVFVYANGAVYRGQWRRNKKHGEGVLTLQDGAVVSGEFYDDAMPADARPKRAPDSGSGSAMLALDVRELVQQLGAGAPSEAELEEEAAALRKAVLSFNTPLRALYQRFSNVAPAMLKFMTRHQREEKARELALYGTQMWVLAREFDLDQRGATLAALDRAMGAVRLADEVRTGFVSEDDVDAGYVPRQLHWAAFPVTYREFVEVLLRFAQVWDDSADRTVCSKFRRLLEHLAEGATCKGSIAQGRAGPSAADPRSVVLTDAAWREVAAHGDAFEALYAEAEELSSGVRQRSSAPFVSGLCKALRKRGIAEPREVLAAVRPVCGPRREQAAGLSEGGPPQEEKKEEEEEGKEEEAAKEEEEEEEEEGKQQEGEEEKGEEVKEEGKEEGEEAGESDETRGGESSSGEPAPYVSSLAEAAHWELTPVELLETLAHLGMARGAKDAIAGIVKVLRRLGGEEEGETEGEGEEAEAKEGEAAEGGEEGKEGEEAEAECKE